MKLRLKKAGKFIGYISLGIFIIATTIALVAYGQGYFYSSETGRITSGGLFYISSRPSGAEIIIDGQRYGRTSDRVRLPVGEYTLELHRDGYRTWSKILPIGEAAVTSVQYPILIPSSVTTNTAAALDRVIFFSQSPDQRHLVVAEHGSPDRIRVFSGSTMSTPEAVFLLPDDVNGYSISDLAWSPEATNMLLTATSRGSVHQFAMDVGIAADPVSLTDIFEESITQPFITDSLQIIYGLSGSDLKRYNVVNQTETELANDIQAYTVIDDSVYALQTQPNQLDLVHITGGITNVITSYPLGNDYDISAISYERDIYLLLHNQTNKQVTIVSDLASDQAKTVSLAPGIAQDLIPSPNGRFITMYKDDSFVTYDLRYEETYRFVLEGMASQPSWYSNHHLLAARDNEVILFEFDGGNQEFITRAEHISVYGNLDLKTIYSIRHNQLTNGLELQRSLLE